MRQGFFCGSAGKESACNAGDTCSTPRSGRSTGEGIGYPLQCSCTSLVAQMVKNSPVMQGTWVNTWVGKIPWRRRGLPTPVFFAGEFHGQSNLAGYSPWGQKELDMTVRLSFYMMEKRKKCWTNLALNLINFFVSCTIVILEFLFYTCRLCLLFH